MKTVKELNDEVASLREKLYTHKDENYHINKETTMKILKSIAIVAATLYLCFALLINLDWLNQSWKYAIWALGNFIAVLIILCIGLYFLNKVWKILTYDNRLY